MAALHGNVGFPQRQLNDDLKTKARLFIANRKNANNVIDILGYLDDSPEKNGAQIVAAIQALKRIFQFAIRKKWMAVKSAGKAAKTEKAFKLWLRGIYAETKEQLLGHLTCEKRSVQSAAAHTLLRFFELECQFPGSVDTGKSVFPEQYFQSLISSCLSSEKSMAGVISLFERHIMHNDVCFRLLNILHKFLKTKRKQGLSDFYLRNFLVFLDLISSAMTHFSSDLNDEGIEDESDKVEILTSPGTLKTLYSNIWMEFLGNKLNASMYKQILILLPNKVLMHLQNPLLLTDFLIDSYKIGGLISLLALNGIFILIRDHNLEYPDFYEHLYNILTVDIFFVKYKARFFSLMDLFLSSTHVPEYLVAAFIKKLSRLSLAAPPNALVMLIPFIRNLMVRHNGLIRLIQNPSVTSFETDPYLVDEKDPSKSCVAETSLWEIQTLQSHYHPAVVKEANRIKKQLPTMEQELDEALEETYKDMIDTEFKYEIEDAALAVASSSGLLENADDQMSDYWSLSS